MTTEAGGAVARYSFTHGSAAYRDAEGVWVRSEDYATERAARESAERERDLAREAAAALQRGSAHEYQRAEAAEAREAALRSRCEAIVWFVWSGNDADAVAAIDRLRELLSAGGAGNG